MISAIKTLNKRGQHNWTKIVCLAVGLAAGVVLMGKVGFEQSYDDFFPTSERIYVVCEDVIRDGDYLHFAHKYSVIPKICSVSTKNMTSGVLFEA